MSQATKTTTVWLWTESNQNRFGDEYPTFCVAKCDDDGEPTGRVYDCSSRSEAFDLSEKVAGRTLEIINDMTL